MGETDRVAYTAQQLEKSEDWSDMNRWTAIHIKFFQTPQDQFFGKYGLSLGNALQVVEYMKAAEFVFHRTASLDDVAAVSGKTKTTFSTNLNKLVKSQIIMKLREGTRLSFIPHPGLYNDDTEPDSASRPKAAVEAQIANAVDVKQVLSPGTTSADKKILKAEKRIDQGSDLAINAQMKLIVDYHRALRDEIWDRLGERTAKKARTITMAQVLDVLVAVGETNDWVPIQDLADASGAKLSWASKLTTDLEQLEIVEKLTRSPAKGVRGAIALTRLNPAFLSAVQSRSRLSFSSGMPTQASAPSSSAPSTSDTLPA